MASGLRAGPQRLGDRPVSRRDGHRSGAPVLPPFRPRLGGVMKILLVAGARPNFVKIAPILNEITNHPSLEPVLVHTGQHYDAALSDRFFSDLGIWEADVKLGVGSGSHAIQTAEVLNRIEPVLEELRPDLVLVVGDGNSTLAAAL